MDGATAAGLLDVARRYHHDPARGRDTRLTEAVDGLRRRVGDGGVQDAATAVMGAWVRAAGGLAGRRSGQVLSTQRAAWVDSAAREVAHARRAGPDTVLLRAWHHGLGSWADELAGGPGLLDGCRDRGLTSRNLTLAAVGVLVTALDLLGVALELDLADHPDPARRERTATAAAAVVLTATLGCATGPTT